MTEQHACNDATFIRSFDGWLALPQLLRALAKGQPVALAELADSVGQPTTEIERILRAQPGTEWNSEGRLIGFGLTSRPTDYRFLAGGKPLYTWCATDTLLFTILLGEDTIAESTCPTTGIPIRLELAPDGVTSVTPSETVVSQIHRAEFIGNLRSDVCDHGHFFASRSSAGDWVTEHPQGQVLSVADAFAQCRAACEELGWIDPAVTSR